MSEMLIFVLLNDLKNKAMFGIGGGEMIFIIFIALMLFGSDKIPEIARTLAKGLAQLKNATDEIKGEIQKSAEENGFDTDTLTGGIKKEIDGIKGSFRKFTAEGALHDELDNITNNFRKMAEEAPVNAANISEISADITTEINKAKENLEDLSGPIKRQ